MSLACRLCRVPLAADAGCVACDPVRRNLVAIGEDEDEKPSLSGTGSEIVAGIRGQLRVVRQGLKHDPSDERMETRLLRLGNTAAKVLEAARKLQADGLAAVEAMSFSEKADLFINWYASLPPPYRRALREKMGEFEIQVATPLADDAGGPPGAEATLS